MPMRVVSPKAIRDFATLHPEAEASLWTWYNLARKATWKSPSDVLQTFNRADTYRRCHIFNISGGVRLIAAIHFNTGRVFIRNILTHEEYDRDRWKNDCEERK